MPYHEPTAETTSTAASLVQSIIKALLVISFVVIPPLATLIYMRWEDLRPYVIADADTAEGTLYYFTGSG